MWGDVMILAGGSGKVEWDFSVTKQATLSGSPVLLRDCAAMRSSAGCAMPRRVTKQLKKT